MYGNGQYYSLPESAVPGQLYFDTGVNKMKMYDGSIWNEITLVSDAQLTATADDAIDHVIEKINNNPQLTDFADKYPMVADAIGQLETVLKLHQNLEDNDPKE